MNRKDIPLIIACCFIFMVGFMDRSMAKQAPLKIAICQIFALDGDREGNFVRIENAIIEAKEQGAKIACLPETTILGWVNPDAHQRAFAIPGDDSNRLCELARKHEIYVSAGLAEKDGDNLYDSALLIDDGGNILIKHRKINTLTELMDPPYTRGEDVQTADTPLGRIGLLICADSFDNDVLKRMADLKPDIMLVPYGWAAKEDAWPEHGKALANTVSNAAKVIGAPLIGTDLVGEISHGPWTGQIYGGQSVAADKNGTILNIAKDRDRDILLLSLHR